MAILSDKDLAENQIRANVVRDILKERIRQVVDEKFDSTHDDDQTNNSLSSAAACYAITERHYISKEIALRELWPWDNKWWKPKDQRSNLIRAAALIIAEIERLDRKDAQHGTR